MAGHFAPRLSRRLNNRVADHEQEVDKPQAEYLPQVPTVVQLQQYIGNSGVQRMLANQRTIQRSWDDYLPGGGSEGGGWSASADTPLGSVSVGNGPGGWNASADTSMGSVSASSGPEGWSGSVDTDSFSGSASSGPQGWK